MMTYQWFEAGWDGLSWCDGVAPVDTFVCELGAEQAVHGVVERGDLEVAEKHLD